MSARTFLRSAALCLGVVMVGRPAAAATMTVAWDANSSAYIAGYIVSYGTQSGDYTVHVDVGTQTSQQLSGLTDGVTYYFIVQSYDEARLLSVPSQEVYGRAGATATAPKISCPSPTATSYTGGPVPITFSPVVAGGTAPINTTCAPASGSLFSVGTTPLSCSATDALQLTSSCSSVVVVTSSAPAAPAALPLAISCPVIPSTVAKNGSFAKVTFSNPVVTGGSAPVSTSCSPASGSQFPVGTTPVICTATDAAHVTATCGTSVTVTSANSPAPLPISGTPTEFDTVISGLSGKCPSVTFSAAGKIVVINAATDFSKGSCSALDDGKSVHVKGLVQSSGQTVATTITFIK